MSNRKPYIQHQRATWWLKNPFFISYMIRDGTSIFSAAYNIVLIWGLIALAQGEQAFIGWLDLMSSSGMILFHSLALISTMIHSTTWFKLTPKLIPLQLGGFRVPDLWIQAGQCFIFAIVSLSIIFAAINWL